MFFFDFKALSFKNNAFQEQLLHLFLPHLILQIIEIDKKSFTPARLLWAPVKLWSLYALNQRDAGPISQ